MRVLFTSDVYAPHLGGGTEAVIKHLAERLANRGHQVGVATLDGDGCARSERMHSVDVFRLPSVDLTRLLRLQFTFALAWPFWLGSIVRRLRPDVVNAQNLFFFTTLPAIIVARLLRIPIVLTLQVHSLAGLSGMVGALCRLYEQTLGRIAVRLASHTVCVGPSVADYFEELGGKAERSTIILNGVDPGRFAPTHRPRGGTAVLYVGRLVDNKGAFEFARAARAVTARWPDVEFWMAGDGPLHQGIERLVAGACRIRLLGQRGDVSELMKQACVFVRPSRSEGLSLAILEAMASGLPVVASDIPGNRDLICHGENGYLVDPSSPDQIAAAIEKLLGDPGLRERLGTAGRARVLQLTSWELATDRLERLFLSVAGCSSRMASSSLS